jgi:S-DNA-T family DNA segregation ATPase FtsK/SpoIIIE
MSMPAIERVIPLVGQLPAAIREALGRRLRELAGLGLIALTGVAAAALMTWSVQDPSLSHATSRAIRNVVGYPGAICADFLMQILGLGAIMLILPVAIWGWRMLTHRAFDREALRLGCWILCTVISAGFASCWPHGGAWPLPTGLGGVVGDALVRAPAASFIASCSGPCFSPPAPLHSCSRAAWARARRKMIRPRSKTTTCRSRKTRTALRSRWDGPFMP